MDLKEIVRATASAQSLLDANEELQVSSISIVELVLGLEEATGVAIPDREMTVDNFSTLASVVQLLSRLKAAKQA